MHETRFSGETAVTHNPTDTQVADALRNPANKEIALVEANGQTHTFNRTQENARRRAQLEGRLQKQLQPREIADELDAE